jgi:D-sedoheptulose 7-phosphate isomerase
LKTTTPQLEKIAGIWNAHLETAKTLPSVTEDVSRAIDIIVESLAVGGLLMWCGNGGSAADAQHMAAELTGRFLIERRPFRSMALHVNTSALTAIGNDYGYDLVFAREVAAHARPGDVLLAISTSGNSANILRAIETAHEHKVKVIGLTGETGGKMNAVCDLCLRVPAKSTPRIQEMHVTICHAICEIVEERLAKA